MLSESQPGQLALTTGYAAQVPQSQSLVGWFIDEVRARGNEPPKRIVGQVAQAVKKLLDEGQSPGRVRSGLGLMVEKGIFRPQLLAQFVMEAAARDQRNILRYGRGMTSRQMLDASQ